MDEYFKIIRSNKVENMNFIAKFWKYRHVLRYIHKTIYFNFRSLPFRQAVKLPIWLYRPDIVSCKGNVEFGGAKIRTGMVRLGFNMVSIYSKNGIMIENKGKIIFHGRCSIGNNSYISLGRRSTVSFGNQFTATASFRLASFAGITFGDRVSVGWDSLFIDTDFHRLTRVDGMPVKAYGKIKVGNNVWFGNNCMILKNTRIPDFTTVAAGTQISEFLDVPEKSIVGTKKFVTVLREGCWRKFEDDRINYN